MVDRSLLCRWSRPLNPPLLCLLVSTSPGLFNNDKIWACSAWIFPGTTQRGGSRVGGGGYTVRVANRTLLNVGGSLRFFFLPVSAKQSLNPECWIVGLLYWKKILLLNQIFSCLGFRVFFLRSNSDSSGLLLLAHLLCISYNRSTPGSWELPVTAPLLFWSVRSLAGIWFQCIKGAKLSLWTENGSISSLLSLLWSRTSHMFSCLTRCP